MLNPAAEMSITVLFSDQEVGRRSVTETVRKTFTDADYSPRTSPR